MHLSKVVKAFNIINEHLITHLPVDTSLLPFFILTITVQSSLQKKELSIKCLCNQLKWSATGVRKHIAKLEKENWIQIHTSKTDKRVKIITPTEQLVQDFTSLSICISHLFVDHHQNKK